MKQEITRVTQYLAVQMEKANVNIRLNEEVTPGLIEEMKPDVVIIASGSEPIIPKIPGVNSRKVVTAHEVIGGRIFVNPGNVVIIGGGIVGCEVADQIANLGYNHPGTRVDVIVVEMLKEVVADLSQANRYDLLQRLREKEVKILTSTEVKVISDGSVTVVRDGQEEKINGIDLVILAVGVKPVDILSDQIRDKVAEVYVIGDAREPRSALEAIAEGMETARKI
jgi:pyruvate/2-oxoglutarate dehydrogenase complex dihydrolipoamide dehydrogenase (E3) component